VITKKTAALSIGVLILLAVPAGVGQTCTQYVQCEWDSWDSGCNPPLPPTAYNCQTVAPYVAQCTVRTYSCPAPPECPTCNRAGAPIDLASGNTLIAQSDIRLPGLGGGLTLARTWNSLWPPTESAYREGIFGPNWRSTFEERVFGGSDGYVKYSRGDGSFWSFGYSGTVNSANVYAVASPANETATLAQTTSNWTLTFKNGEQRVFDVTSGNLLSIADRNGNTIQLTYDSSYRLVSVTDPASRHLYFSYASPSSYLVTSVSSDVGLSLSYSYDGLGRLVKVTKPDQTTISFQYDSNSFVSAVLDSNGKVLESHTYDTNGRGLTSSRAGGVEAITVTYP